MNNRQIIARKYAKAFLNLYLDEVTSDDFNAIKHLAVFFSKHKKSLYFLSIPSIHTETKKEAIDELLKKFKLYHIFEPLVRTLISAKRTFLIYDILKEVVLLYKQRKNIMMFNIISSHQLDDSDVKIIEKFLAIKTNKKIMSQSAIDKELVAGIRLQSDTLLWEYSIYKQCEALRKKFNI